MKITIYNYTPKTLSEFLNNLHKTLSSNTYESPITIDFGFYHFKQIQEPYDCIVTAYDYYDSKGEITVLELDDANLYHDFDDIQLSKIPITLDGTMFTLKENPNIKITSR